MAESARRRGVTPPLRGWLAAVARARAHTPHSRQRARADATASACRRASARRRWGRVEASGYAGQGGDKKRLAD
jgi:hypothetical protein